MQRKMDYNFLSVFLHALSRLACCLLVGATMIIATGCEDRVAIAEQEIETIRTSHTNKDSQPIALEPIPTVPQMSSISYVAPNTQDPFDTPVSKIESQALQTNKTKQTPTSQTRQQTQIQTDKEQKKAKDNQQNQRISQQSQQPTSAQAMANPRPESTPVINQNISRPDKDRAREPLEAYPLSSLTFKGIVVSPQGQVLGLVALPNGTLATVVVGEYMGEDSGRVVAINENHIRLEQLVFDGNRYVKAERLISLPR